MVELTLAEFNDTLLQYNNSYEKLTDLSVDFLVENIEVYENNGHEAVQKVESKELLRLRDFRIKNYQFLSQIPNTSVYYENLNVLLFYLETFFTYHTYIDEWLSLSYELVHYDKSTNKYFFQLKFSEVINIL